MQICHRLYRQKGQTAPTTVTNGTVRRHSLGLICPKHGYLFIKFLDYFFKLRMTALHYQRNIVFLIAIYQQLSPSIKIRLLPISIKSPQKQAAPHCLLLIGRVTHVKQNIRICIEELFQNKNDGRTYFCIIRRGLLTTVRQVKPIRNGTKPWYLLLFKPRTIPYPIVTFKTVLVTPFLNLIGGHSINPLNIQICHG